jgi:hypothetical protein
MTQCIGTHDNDIGVSCILQSKAPGGPLSNYRWSETSIQPPGFKPLSRLPLFDLDRQKIMKQLGVIMSRLWNVRFDKIGLLFEDVWGFSVGECVSPVFTWQSRDSIEAEIDRGPFPQEEDYFRSLISIFESTQRSFHSRPIFSSHHYPNRPIIILGIAIRQLWIDEATSHSSTTNSKVARIGLIIVSQARYSKKWCLYFCPSRLTSQYLTWIFTLAMYLLTRN